MVEPVRDSRILQSLIGQNVIIDVHGLFVYAGELKSSDHLYLELIEADVHDLRDSNTNRELYVHETRTHGIRANRTRVLVRLDEVVSISLLDDVIP